MQRPKTVVWSLLLVVAIPAASTAAEFWVMGDVQAALGAAVVGFAGFVLFFVSFVAEFPGERDIKRLLQDRELSESELKHLANEVGQVVDSFQSSRKLSEDEVREVAEAVVDLLDDDGSVNEGNVSEES